MRAAGAPPSTHLSPVAKGGVVSLLPTKVSLRNGTRSKVATNALAIGRPIDDLDLLRRFAAAASVRDAGPVHSAAARAGMASRRVQPSPPNPRPTQT
jgi:hypothetical protein